MKQTKKLLKLTTSSSRIQSVTFRIRINISNYSTREQGVQEYIWAYAGVSTMIMAITT